MGSTRYIKKCYTSNSIGPSIFIAVAYVALFIYFLHILPALHKAETVEGNDGAWETDNQSCFVPLPIVIQRKFSISIYHQPKTDTGHRCMRTILCISQFVVCQTMTNSTADRSLSVVLKFPSRLYRLCINIGSYMFNSRIALEQ